MFSSPVHETYYGSKRSGADIEEKMAREIQRMKLENEARTREIEKICAESEEIRQLKDKIKAAYVSKERAAQISENQIRKIDDIKRDAEIDDIVLRHNYEEWQREQARETERKMKQLSGKDVIRQQIDEKKAKGEEAYREYLKEKGQVETIVNRIIEEDMKKMAEEQSKKKQNFQNMIETLEEKRIRLLREKEQEKADNKRYLEFYQQKEKQAEDIRAKKLELEAAKDQIFQKLKAEQEAQLREKEMLEDLRMQLHLEEFDATERFKDRMERQKKQSQKEQMQQAEKEAHSLKQQKKEEEERMEKEYRRMMLEKFALDDKLEQMSVQKRRMKELEHKKEVEKLWQDRLEVYRAEREKEAWEHQRKIEEEKIRADIIKRERERLLQEHMPHIAEFMPKGTVEKPEEFAYATRGGFNNTNNSNRYGYK